MKRYKKSYILLLMIFLTSMFLQCSKYEEAPFFDGLYLKYHEVFGNPQKHEGVFWTREIEYRFKQLEDGNFHISQVINTQRGKKMPDKLEPVLYPAVGDDLTIDPKGIVLKGGDFMNFAKGYPSYLWLPSNKRKRGAEVIEVIRKVERKTRWERWEVWPVKGKLGDIYYYDTNTGILVGVENLKGKLKMTLIDTNLGGLKTSLTKSLNNIKQGIKETQILWKNERHPQNCS